MKKVITLFVSIVIVLVVFIDPAICAQWLETGQSGELMVSGVDFNDAGFLQKRDDGLFFNHPGNIASDGTRLLLADRNNNRVLLWSTLPKGNISPDVVIGQKNLTENNTGSGLSGLNWPVGVAIGGGKIVVADTYNNRLLVWNSIPQGNGTAADIEIPNILWPWAVWTDGTMLIATATSASKTYIWKSFPLTGTQPPDITLTGKDQNGNSMFGTPRTIGTDGHTYLVIGDHNSKVTGHAGSFFWKTFPSGDVAYDFSFQPSEVDPNLVQWGGVVTDDGRYVSLGGSLYVWNTLPTGSGDNPDMTIHLFNAGDGAAVVLADKYLFMSLPNDNKIVAYSTFTLTSQQTPDIVIGSTDFNTNTLTTNAIITNAVLATDGTSLFATSDFDRKLYVWKALPGVSGTHPDFICNLNEQVWDNELYKGMLLAAGRGVLYVWKTLPLASDLCTYQEVSFQDMQDIQGVAIDDSYIYLADRSSNKIYVWSRGALDTLLANSATVASFTLSTDRPARLSSDGKYLIVVSTDRSMVSIYDVKTLSAQAQPLREFDNNHYGDYSLNLPQGALITSDGFFIADTVHNRVLAWANVSDAIAGNTPDVILGQSSSIDTNTQIGEDKLFWPATMAYDGSSLWVGEYKFSSRVVAFRNPSTLPVPSITINESSADAYSSIGNKVVLRLRLNPATEKGVEADWWLAADTPSGWYHYDAFSGQWKTDLAVSYQGVLSVLPATDLYGIESSTKGKYVYYFAIDTNNNGSPDYDKLHFDSITVTTSQ